MNCKHKEWEPLHGEYPVGCLEMYWCIECGTLKKIYPNNDGSTSEETFEPSAEKSSPLLEMAEWIDYIRESIAIKLKDEISVQARVDNKTLHIMVIHLGVRDIRYAHSWSFDELELAQYDFIDYFIGKVVGVLKKELREEALGKRRK